MFTLLLFFVDGSTSIITYNNMTSTPDQGLYLIFDENAQGPSILCSGSGNLPPTVRWVRENGRGLPSGISQSVQSIGNVLLRWQRPMEFTDSGSYHCQASNNVRNSSVSLEILVQSKLIIAVTMVNLRFVCMCLSVAYGMVYDITHLSLSLSLSLPP